MLRDLYPALGELAAWLLVLGPLFVLALRLGRLHDEWQDSRPPPHDRSRCERCNPPVRR